MRVPIYSSMDLHQKKTFFLISFCSASDAASILKNLRTDAVLEPEIVIKYNKNHNY